MDTSELQPIVEAMIFVSQEPIEEKALLTALASIPVSQQELRTVVEAIRVAWNENPQTGLQLIEVAGGFQFRTKEHCAPWMKALNIPKATRLTPAALETLAVVAYRQPCIRSDIEGVRGVDSGAVLKTLLERRLIRIVGRRDEAGQPLVYGTTKDFLELFNFRDLSELPPLKDIQELIIKSRVRTESSPLDIVPLMAGDDEEEPTDVIVDDADDDDETEPIDESDEEEALMHLENSLKDLRQLERNVLAATPLGQTNEKQEEGNVVSETTREGANTEAEVHPVTTGDETGNASRDDEAPAVDRGVN